MTPTVDLVDIDKPVVFDVRGIPAPQGSKRAVRLGNGRIGMVESSEKVKPWRDAVTAETLRYFGRMMFTGPVVVTLNFRLQRPASAPARITHPGKYPDLDKLVRSTLDALKKGGAFLDDGQVVGIATSKEFGKPGCLISVREIGGCVR